MDFQLHLTEEDRFAGVIVVPSVVVETAFARTSEDGRPRRIRSWSGQVVVEVLPGRQ